jgi:hypothetical protein
MLRRIVLVISFGRQSCDARMTPYSSRAFSWGGESSAGSPLDVPLQPAADAVRFDIVELASKLFLSSSSLS